jgi:methylenetetrahydrofolate dehydrogenase (NADP+)/methenyltetrahydrofolate cyclohydrolase
MLILNGKLVAESRFARLKTKLETFNAKHASPPGLAVILVGENPASQVYVRNKTKVCGDLGMISRQLNLPATSSQAELEAKISELNDDPLIHAILVQLPLPKHLNEEKALDKIKATKDADGLHIENQGLLWAGRPRIIPCTPNGVMAIFEHYDILLKSKKAVVIGRSQIVGKPMANLLLSADATLSICHSKTTNLFDYTREADIVVVAAGQPRFLGREAFKKGAVVIDVGMHRPHAGEYAGKLCGDVRFEELDGWVSAATPVPGGVGPMTIQMLMENTFHLAELSSLSSES